MHELWDIAISFALVFEENPPRYENDVYLPSTKLENSFHVNMKTFEIFMIQTHFHRNGAPPPKEWLCKKATSSFLQAVKAIKKIRLWYQLKVPWCHLEGGE
jgi:hypothetical protein